MWIKLLAGSVVSLLGLTAAYTAGHDRGTKEGKEQGKDESRYSKIELDAHLRALRHRISELESENMINASQRTAYSNLLTKTEEAFKQALATSGEEKEEALKDAREKLETIRCLLIKVEELWGHADKEKWDEVLKEVVARVEDLLPEEVILADRLMIVDPRSGAVVYSTPLDPWDEEAARAEAAMSNAGEGKSPLYESLSQDDHPKSD